MVRRDMVAHTLFETRDDWEVKFTPTICRYLVTPQVYFPRVHYDFYTPIPWENCVELAADIVWSPKDDGYLDINPSLKNQAYIDDTYITSGGVDT